MARVLAAIVGPGNIGTDLLANLRRSDVIEVGYVVGVVESDGITRARDLGISASAGGVEWLLEQDPLPSIVFDATSASAHIANDRALAGRGHQLIDLTPAAIGPYVVPAVNLEEHLDAPNLNMVSCGGQATIPIVAAVGSVSHVHYAEIVASISSRSAGPGTRANIDEFTETTARGLEVVGGAGRGKAIIVLNPAEPPLVMRDTVFCLTEDCDPALIVAAVEQMVAQVAQYVPGYRLKQPVQVDPVGVDEPLRIPDLDRKYTGLKVSVFLEVEGAAHYLPSYAGNLDIMTSAALQTAERIIERRVGAAS